MNLTTAQEAAYKGSDWWEWCIWIDGPANELDAVESVTYRLHPTFPDPIRSIRDRASQFRLAGYGWGEFTIPIAVHLKNGEKLQLRHDLVLERPSSGPIARISGALEAAHFISYSRVNALAFAAELRHALQKSEPPIRTWLDQFNLEEGARFQTAINEAIRDCESFLLVAGEAERGPWAEEWRRALEYRKSVLVLKIQPNAVVPVELMNRQAINFAGDFAAGVAELRRILHERETPVGRLRGMKESLGDVERELAQVIEPEAEARIAKEAEILRQHIADLEGNLERPQEAMHRIEESIEQHFTSLHSSGPETTTPAQDLTAAPAYLVPPYFQDREKEAESIVHFLNDPSLRLLLLQGHGGSGKTALLLRVLWQHQLNPPLQGPAFPDGMVHLAASGAAELTWARFYGGVCELLPAQAGADLRSLYQQKEVGAAAKNASLVRALSDKRVLFVLDAVDAVLNPATANFNEPELEQVLEMLLEDPASRCKILLTSRVAPSSLHEHAPERQQTLFLGSLDQENSAAMLRALDAAGDAGIRSAPPELFAEVYEVTRGNPRAMEALHALLLTDSTIALPKLLHELRTRLSGNPAEALAAEAFSRLGPLPEQVMQALAIFGVAITPAAVDYLLLPFAGGASSEPILERLAAMHFARIFEKSYFLHRGDRQFALRRIPAGRAEDRQSEPPPFTQHALLHRAAGYYRKARTPSETWRSLKDLEPVLMEICFRVAEEDFDEAARVLGEIDFAFLLAWGHVAIVSDLHEQLQGKISDPILQADSFNALAVAYSRNGRLAQAVQAYQKALALVENDPARHSNILSNLATVYLAAGEFGKAVPLLQQAIGIAEAQGTLTLQVMSRVNLGDAYLQSGRPLEATEQQEKALELAREIPDREGEALALRGLGSIAFFRREIETAVTYYRDAHKIAQDINNHVLVAVCASNLAMCLLGSGDYDDAAKGYEEAIEIARLQEARADEGIYLSNLGICWHYQGQLEKAADCYEAGRMIGREVGDLGGEATALENRGFLALDRADFPKVKECFDASLAIALKTNDHGAQSYAIGGTADLALSQDRLDDAKALAEEAINLAKRGENSTGQLWSGYTLAQACLRAGDLAAAWSAIAAALVHHDPMHQHFGYVLAGAIALRRGDPKTAGENFDAALSETGRLIKLCPLNYKAFTSAALAHAGLALCRDQSEVVRAQEALRAGDAIVQEPGTLNRRRHLLEQLSVVDKSGILTRLRPKAEGAVPEATEIPA